MTDARDEVADRQADYKRDMARRQRRLAWAARLRSFVLQATWVIVLAAGAAIPLSAAMSWPDWVAPTLGFVVVLATGIEKIFSRTTAAAAAVDRLRRHLEQEGRLFHARQMDYAGADDPFEIYVTRSEAAIQEFDRSMLTYGQRMAVRRDT